MKTHALLYGPPPRWPIASALGAAVLIHLSAVAIAFHRESIPTEAAPVYVPFGFDPPVDPSMPPEPDISLSPPPPAPTADFIEPNIARELKPQRSATPPRASGQPRLAAAGNAKAWALNAPRPDYPYEARSRHITGSGVVIITVDSNTGVATEVTMEQSTGNPILDNSTVSAFRRWRFKPGAPPRVRIPITFLLTGAHY